ncbi:hypothetical protein [Aquimarina sp. AU119]|uniref:hypothetical protein n=1 Tax=Aquimarina sp. AU119 TaxID=2108528 RepID=UPI000D68954E|nr:hypothetical protein [Aquimarina sp. AU119]
MKRTVTILTILFLGLGLLSAQSRESILKEIRSEYKLIRNNMASYIKKDIDIELNTTEGSYITAYLDHEDLKLIEVTEFGETGKNIIAYYFKDKKLFFAFNQRHKYNRPIYWDEKAAKEIEDGEVFDLSKTKIIEDRYYFDNEKIFLWLDKNKNKVDLTIKANLSIEKVLITESNRLKSELEK